MVKLMADMEMAEAYLTSKGATENTPENRDRIINYLLEKNGLSREEYDSTINWYGRHFDKYDEMYAKVDKELSSRGKKVSGKAEEVVTTDLWPYARRAEITPLSSSDNITFRLIPEANEKGSKIDWKLNFHSALSCNGMLGVTYEDGDSFYVTKSFSGSGNFELNFQTDTGKVVKNVFGNLRITDLSSPVRVDSIRLEAIPYDSTEYYRIYSQRKYRGPIPKRKMETVNDTILNSEDSRHTGEGTMDSSDR